MSYEMKVNRCLGNFVIFFGKFEFFETLYLQNVAYIKKNCNFFFNFDQKHKKILELSENYRTFSKVSQNFCNLG